VSATVGVELDRARDDVRAFAEVLGVQMRDWQARGLSMARLFTCLLASRQMGKSLSVMVTALWWAFRSPDQVVLLAAPSEESARRLLATAAGLLRSSPLATSVVDASGSVLRLSNGSTLRALSASESAARGWSADLLVVDESQLVPESMFAALLPTVTARERGMAPGGHS
jgi:tRNA(Met) C34 N-acetyltransferase TmcA